ncbi:MAG: PAAR domain-containing protein [Gemmatimonadetes bacterium]|nr:PAAR domain-containing protein [Gemmatimonadota bacterium]
MSQPAARVSDLHTCPMQTPMPPPAPPVPHVGGPILPPGNPKTLIGGLPAARVGDLCTCVGPPDSIVKGSATVMIGGQPAARMGDSTAHGGVIAAGFPKVLIGDSGSGSGGSPLGGLAQAAGEQRQTLREAAAEGSAFCEICDRARRAAEAPPESGSSQRQSLVAAAANGTPFCEECARAARESVAPAGGFVDPEPTSQRATLRQAARDGVPFCEECAKAAAERH